MLAGLRCAMPYKHGHTCAHTVIARIEFTRKLLHFVFLLIYFLCPNKTSVLNVCVHLCVSVNAMSAPMCAWVIQFDLCSRHLGVHASVNVPLVAACVHSSSNAITVVLIGLRHPMPHCIIRLNSRLICAHGFGPLSSLQPPLTLASVL